jgi:hypothetical protein
MNRSLSITTADLADLTDEEAALLGTVFDAPGLVGAELAHVLSTPALAAELARVRTPRPQPTTALADGSARRRRDERIAEREARVRQLLAEVADVLAARVTRQPVGADERGGAAA